MNYTLHQLKVFTTVADLLSITKAAEALHLTQPAVSIQLRNFQEQFPLALTEILGKKLYLTEFGEEILETSKKILLEAEKINDSVNRFHGQISGTLKLSVVSTGKYVMPYFLNGFIDAHPGVKLKMDVTNKAQVVESLENNEVDFSLVSILPERMNLEAIPLMQNKLYLVGSREFIQKHPVKDIADLEQVPIIIREEGSGTRQTVERFISFNNLNIQSSMELTSNEAVKQAVIAGLGYSIMPLIGIKNAIQYDNLLTIPLKGFPLTSQWQLVWLKNKRFSLAAQAYISYIEQHKSEIIEQKFDWFEAYQ
jgi:DNA-binding transcriptional LysR family regulator